MFAYEAVLELLSKNFVDKMTKLDDVQLALYYCTFPDSCQHQSLIYFQLEWKVNTYIQSIDRVSKTSNVNADVTEMMNRCQ